MLHDDVHYAQYKAQRIKELCPSYNKPGVAILDVGCGNGLLTYYLQAVFFDAHVIGADTDERALAHARTTYPDLFFYTLDALEQQIKRGEFLNEVEKNRTIGTQSIFDLVIIADVLHHIPDSEHNDLLKKVSQLKKTNGNVIVFDINPFNKHMRTFFQKQYCLDTVQLINPYALKRRLARYGQPHLYFCNTSIEHWPFFFIVKFALSRLAFGNNFIIIA